MSENPQPVLRPVLRIEHLRVLHRDGGAPLVDGVSLDLAPGETLGLVGESGSGKSLTLRAVLGILPAALRAEGTVERAGARAAMVFQEPAIALNPTMRVGHLVARTWRLHHPGATRGQARDEAAALLERVGIPRARARLAAWPHELSGGMRQRVMIAAALATDPGVLLCDEPTTALDVRVQAQILDLLRDLVASRDMAMVFVSHDLAVVGSLCERIAVMRSGQIVEEGRTAAVLRAPGHPYTRELLAANLARRLADAATKGARP
ncbi:ABC transporter ATP-binding protein [Actinomadura macrotermitis]|uniref:Oligopeptide transport ATP-binding protein OppD n=1 Tax=Actinomadura macrotermitis TaxID=2585200 RepID=A0A7K0C694_9ACTN|nr:ABC transporter ATP-binding protein [Actinomadura macrotermitis]MQY08334.1 Oligopeptide transport ATP-binding protein OppD [Actinomadura macrotermitis]